MKLTLRPVGGEPQRGLTATVVVAARCGASGSTGAAVSLVAPAMPPTDEVC